MYFKEKEDTNIDSEFEKKRKLNINLNIIKEKPKLFIIGGVILLIIIILLITLSNKNKYILELLGEQTINIKLGNDYIEPGFVAYDKKHNDCRDKVKVTNNVDISKTGKYEISYRLENITKTRYVIVTEKLIETYIHLKGRTEMYLEIGEKYVEPGYEVYDSLGEKLTENVKVTGNVNTNKLGTYELTYTVVNSKNVTIIAKRIITVVEKK